jgi:hypothetical protein
MVPVTSLEQEMAPAAFLPIQFLLQVLSIALHILGIIFEENADPGKV